jgi:hypothetical protein
VSSSRTTTLARRRYRTRAASRSGQRGRSASRGMGPSPRPSGRAWVPFVQGEHGGCALSDRAQPTPTLGAQRSLPRPARRPITGTISGRSYGATSRGSNAAARVARCSPVAVPQRSGVRRSLRADTFRVP